MGQVAHGRGREQGLRAFGSQVLGPCGTAARMPHALCYVWPRPVLTVHEPLRTRGAAGVGRQQASGRVGAEAGAVLWGCRTVSPQASPPHCLTAQRQAWATAEKQATTRRRAPQARSSLRPSTPSPAPCTHDEPERRVPRRRPQVHCGLPRCGRLLVGAAHRHGALGGGGGGHGAAGGQTVPAWGRKGAGDGAEGGRRQVVSHLASANLKGTRSPTS